MSQALIYPKPVTILTWHQNNADLNSEHYSKILKRKVPQQIKLARQVFMAGFVVVHSCTFRRKCFSEFKRDGRKIQEFARQNNHQYLSKYICMYIYTPTSHLKNVVITISLLKYCSYEKFHNKPFLLKIV